MSESNSIKWGFISGQSDDRESEQVYQVMTVGGKPKPVYIAMPYGISANLPPECTVVMLSPGGSGQDEAGIATNPENRFHGMKLWELKVGNFKTRANVFFDDAGDVCLQPQGTAKAEDWAVQYSELKLQFDALVQSHNALVDIVNSLTLPVVGAVPASPPTAPVAGPLPVPIAQHSTADISGAKVDKVRLP